MNWHHILRLAQNFGTKYFALLATCFHAGFLLSLFFYPKDGSNIFLRNVA
jgi:hypothetical protein